MPLEKGSSSKAIGHNVGTSPYEADQLDFAKKCYEDAKGKIILPLDVVVAAAAAAALRTARPRRKRSCPPSAGTHFFFLRTAEPTCAKQSGRAPRAKGGVREGGKEGEKVRSQLYVGEGG